MQSWNAAGFPFFFVIRCGAGGGGGDISGRVRALNLTVPLGSGRVRASVLSPCRPLAPAERRSTFQWPHGSWHRCQWAAHVHTVLPRTNHLPASPLFEIKLFNLTVFSSLSFFFFISCTYISPCHRALVHSSFWTPLRSLTGLCLRDCTCLYLLIHNNKLN